MDLEANEEKLLHAVTLQNARSILQAREQAEAELLTAKEALERKTKEVAEEREWFRVTLSSIGDAVITTNTEGKVTFLNATAQNILGWKEEEVLGEPLDRFFNLINEHTRERAPNPITRALAQGIVVGLANDTVLIARDGRDIAIQDSAAPIRDAEGKILGAVIVFHDETERRQAQNALQRSEQLLSDLFENGAIAIHWVGPDGTILRANRAELELLGYSEEEYIGRNIADFHVDQPVIEDILNKLTLGDTLDAYEARLRCKDGSVKHVIIYSNVFRENGKFVHTRCFTRDVTKQKLAEHELRKSEERLAALAAVVESSQDAIVSKTLDGIIKTWNKGAEDMFGYAAEEVIGQHITILIPPERHDEETLILGRIRRGEKIEHYETVRKRKNGTLLDISLTVSALRDSNGRIIGASKIARDITDRKRAEKELEELAAREQSRATELETVMESVPVAVWIASDPHCQRITGNAYSHKLLRTPGTINISRPTSAEEYLQGCRCFQNGAQIPNEVLPLQRAARTGEAVWDFQMDLLFEDGSVRHTLINAVPLRDAKGNVRGAIGTGMDVTERRRQQKALEEAQEKKHEELESLVEARTSQLKETIGELEAFSYSISHDMRSPLRAMQGYAEVLLNDYKTKLDADGVLYLNRIRRGALRLDQLIRDVLSYSKIAKGEVHLAAIRSSSVIHSVIQDYPQLAPEKLEVNLTKPLPRVMGHEAYLSQVISNLLGNAVKFVGPGVHPEVKIYAEPAGELVRVWFEDNGLGIALEHHKEIFQIFGRIHAEKRYEGTGIGLAIVKKAIERLGGKVGVVSELGKGSRFG